MNSMRFRAFKGRRPDGTEFDAEVSTTAVVLRDGLRFMAIARDATERRRLDRLKVNSWRRSATNCARR